MRFLASGNVHVPDKFGHAEHHPPDHVCPDLASTDLRLCLCDKKLTGRVASSERSPKLMSCDASSLCMLSPATACFLGISSLSIFHPASLLGQWSRVFSVILWEYFAADALMLMGTTAQAALTD